MQLKVERVDLNPLVRELESSSALRSSRSTFQSIIPAMTRPRLARMAIWPG